MEWGSIGRGTEREKCDGIVKVNKGMGNDRMGRRTEREGDGEREQ